MDHIDEFIGGFIDEVGGGRIDEFIKEFMSEFEYYLYKYLCL